MTRNFPSVLKTIKPQIYTHYIQAQETSSFLKTSGENRQMTNTRNRRGDITTDSVDIKR